MIDRIKWFIFRIFIGFGCETYKIVDSKNYNNTTKDRYTSIVLPVHFYNISNSTASMCILDEDVVMSVKEKVDSSFLENITYTLNLYNNKPLEVDLLNPSFIMETMHELITCMYNNKRGIDVSDGCFKINITIMYLKVTSSTRILLGSIINSKTYMDKLKSEMVKYMELYGIYTTVANIELDLKVRQYTCK